MLKNASCVNYSSLIYNHNDKNINSSNISNNFDIICTNENDNNNINNSSLKSNISVINNNNNPVDKVILKI